jgi:hypothetical protein
MASTVAAPARQVHFSLPPLPYAEDALAPVISAETLKLHHGKHHKKYVDTANQLLEKEPLRASSVEEVVRQAKGKLFNNAAQAWNHDFYWKSLSPKRQRPSGALPAHRRRLGARLLRRLPQRARALRFGDPELPQLGFRREESGLGSTTIAATSSR